MKRAILCAALTIEAALAGCSGGGSGGSPTPGLQPTQPPRATSTASPVPTPPPSTPTPTAMPTAMPTATPASIPPPSNPAPVSPGPTYSPDLLLDGPSYNTAGWLPTALAGSFAFPLEFGFGGTGQSIAILGDGLPLQTDLNTYSAAAGLPRTPTIAGYTYLGGNSTPTVDDSQEATLDVETIAGLAPYATVEYVQLPSLDTVDFTGGLSSTIETLDPNVVSLSFSLCESADTASDAALDSITQEAAATGITIAAATGDQGPTCYDAGDQIAGVGMPASDPYVVAVGGNEDLFSPPYSTFAQVAQSLENPVAWDDPASLGGRSGGGGVSAVWAIPSFQNAPGIVASASSRTFRNVPDIALPSSGAGPTAVYFQGSWVSIYGTSWATPEFAAMQAEINQQCGASRWGLPDLYRVFYQDPGAFIDVTGGNISWPSSSLVYPAGPGYDNASGLGLPIGEQIAVEDGC